MSNIDKITANEQLFTELTPEEGAVVEGGATLQVRYLFANDPPQNDPVIMVGRTNVVFSKDNVDTTQRIFRTREFDNNTTLSIWDRDPGETNGDDLLASVNLTQTPEGIKFLEGGGYRLSYQVL